MNFIITLEYLPANNCTPIIANMSQNIRQTKSTLKMDGIACTKAFTTTCVEEIGKRKENGKSIRLDKCCIQHFVNRTYM